MKNKIFTNSFRTIKKMFPRFLSLLIISFLGTFAFVGLQSTAPNMLDTLDLYLDEANVYDLKIVSSLGLTNEDVDYLEGLEGVKEVEGSYSKDVLMEVNQAEYVVNITSLPGNINTIELIEGKLPENNFEIVVEKNLLIKNDLAIGDKLKFNDSSFKVNQLEIVGTVNSNYYFNNVTYSQNRGTTSIGAGTINYYSFTLPSLFNFDYYTAIYLTVENAKEEITSKETYLSLIEQVEERINNHKTEREENRYSEIVNSLEQMIDDANKELEKAQENLNSIKLTLEQEDSELNKLKKEIEEEKEEINSLLDEVNINENDLDSKINELENLLNSLAKDDPEYEENLNLYQTLIEIKEKKEQLIEKENNYQTRLTIYQANYASYENNLKLYEINKLIIDEKIKTYQEKIESLSSNWLVMNRSDYLTYNEYIEDSGSIANIAKIFPIIFFAVAVLISLVSMNRMVEDDRTEIGTLKSMGFSNKHIIVKYLLFAFLATLFGSISGSLLGAIIIPNLIFSIYTLLFSLPKLYLNFETLSFILGLGITFICVLGTTYYTVIKVLREKPSELMRPKAPKSGRRVWLEKINFIWKKLKFSNKVTIRNLFRYKKRVLVTILGIAGCTALMMCGFGLKDSIVDIPSRQFGDVFTFDAMVYVNNYDLEKDEVIFENEKITSTIELQNINASVNGRKTTIFVIENSLEIDKFVNLNNYKTHEKETLVYNKIAISQKLAQLEGIEVGEILEFSDKNNNVFQYEVSSIVENYIEHYIFMDKETYELSNQEFTPNTVCIQLKDLDELSKENLTKELLTNDKVISISYVSELVERVNNMLKSLDKVVIILIVLASLLSFVVLYNLTNINIQERKRELATLKVLGFYDKEVDSYITKENIILTIFGILIGLILGYFLTQFVIATVEIEKGKFMREIKVMSYIYSAGLTLIFTFIVNQITHFLLKKINMIESLKSVE